VKRRLPTRIIGDWGEHSCCDDRLLWRSCCRHQRSAAQDKPHRIKTATAIFAGGCFWCVEADFDKVAGGGSRPPPATSAYGEKPDLRPSLGRRTGHGEAVKSSTIPAKVTYASCSTCSGTMSNPLAKDKQFCDSGDQYRTAIFYADDEQKKLAEETRKTIAAKFAPRTVYTQVVQAGPFYDAGTITRIIQKNEARYNSRGAPHRSAAPNRSRR